MLQCAPNLRDIGGPPVDGGGTVRTGMLYRGEAIVSPEPCDVDDLTLLEIRTVCDLRSKQERTAARSHWLTTPAQVVTMGVDADVRGKNDPFQVIRDSPNEQGARALMLGIYQTLPSACAPHLKTLFGYLCRGETPMLIHCTAGKDRTGFVVAMILYALGVAKDDIMVDYLLSAERRNNAFLNSTRKLMEARLGAPVSDDMLTAVAGVRREYLERSFAWITERSGSIDAYLSMQADLSDDRRAKLVELLVRS